MIKDLNDLLDRIPIWRKMQGLTGRMDALEERIKELEARLAVAPGEVCQQCGPPAMRLVQVGEIQDRGPNAWREEGWQCKACWGGDIRIKRL